MKQRIIIVDLIAPIGHINWLNKLFSILENNFEIIFISYKSFCNNIHVENKISLDDNLLRSKLVLKNKTKLKDKLQRTKSKIINLFKSYKSISKVKKIIREYDKDIPVYIVGFENISYAIFGFKKRKILLHLHNNLSLSSISLFFFKLITVNNSFIVYEKYIKTGLKKNNNLIYVLNHTLNFQAEDKSLSNDDYIFITSKVHDIKFIEPIIRFAKTKNLKVIFRSELEIKNTGLLISKMYFENYKELLMNSSYVVIIAPYNYRVGGVFYEAMLYNKKIISLGPHGRFIREMNKIYPNTFIQFLKNPNHRTDLNKKNDDYSKFILKHNDLAILNQFQEIIDKQKKLYL